MRKNLINLIKNIVFFAINGLRKGCYFLCMINPVKENRIFVNCFDGMGVGDHPKYIIDELLKMDESAEIIWTYRWKKMISYKKTTFVYPFSLKAIYYQATSKIWISSVRLPYYSIKRKNQFYIQTWHGGLTFKQVEQECEHALSDRYIKTCKHDSKMIDFWVSSNVDNTNLFVKKFWYCGGEILEVGSPRNDIFFGKNEDKVAELKKEYSISGHKIVIYAPTFRKNNSFGAYDLNLKDLTGFLGACWGGAWKLIIRLHPRLMGKSDTFVQYNENTIDGSKMNDIQELLLITDLLITDYSSIALDYMNLDKPVIIYASDIESYKHDRNFHLKLEDTPFPIATNQQELEDAIRFFDNKKYIDDLHRFKDQYGFFDDGKASEKVAKKIYELMRQKEK